MPTIKTVSPHIEQICAEIKTIQGVKDIYLYGSYIEHIASPNYVVKDIDIIAITEFDSGDLFAIDNSKHSALRIHPDELEDEGFNPKAVAFTKKFLGFSKYNVDHWAATSDNKLLHWGAMPDSQEEWIELHTEAEKQAERCTGLKRSALHKASDQKRSSWKSAYEQHLAQFVTSKSVGWYPSENKLAEILLKAKKVE